MYWCEEWVSESEDGAAKENMNFSSKASQGSVFLRWGGNKAGCHTSSHFLWLLTLAGLWLHYRGINLCSGWHSLIFLLSAMLLTRNPQKTFWDKSLNTFEIVVETTTECFTFCLLRRHVEMFLWIPLVLQPAIDWVEIIKSSVCVCGGVCVTLVNANLKLPMCLRAYMI